MALRGFQVPWWVSGGYLGGLLFVLLGERAFGHVDSASTLRHVDDDSVDLVVANYVLMDLPDLDGAVAAARRAQKTRTRIRQSATGDRSGH